MGRQRHQNQDEEQEIQRKQSNSLKSKATHFVSHLTTVFLYPISDKPSKPLPPRSSHDDANICEHNSQSDSEENPVEKIDSRVDELKLSSEPLTENGKKRGIFSRGKQSLGRAFNQIAKFGGLRNQVPKVSSDVVVGDESNSKAVAYEGIAMQTFSESLSLEKLPEMSESSLLLSEKTRSSLYAALPVIVQGRKWMLLYSTWRHGISLSTLYRKSVLWPGPSLLVVGDRNGAVFGGLVEAPLIPLSRRKYQGTNNSFVFTNIFGSPLIFRPTGINHYFTLCNKEYLALGGGSHFALYLDGDLLSGSSSSSETYGNPHLSHTQDFKVKEIELWGFVYASKYEDVLASSRKEAPGLHLCGNFSIN